MSLPDGPSIQNRFEISPGNVDAAWNAVIQLFADRGWEMEALNRSAGIIYARGVEIDPADVDAYMECKSGIMEDVDHLGDFGIAVRQNGEVFTLTVNVEWVVMRTLVTENPVMFHCESTGEFERQFHDSVVTIIG